MLRYVAEFYCLWVDIFVFVYIYMGFVNQHQRLMEIIPKVYPINHP